MPSTNKEQAEVFIELSKDLYTGGYQLSIGVELDGYGHGYRIAGPKFAGNSKSLLKKKLEKYDVEEIQKYLEMVEE